MDHKSEIGNITVPLVTRKVPKTFDEAEVGRRFDGLIVKLMDGEEGDLSKRVFPELR